MHGFEAINPFSGGYCCCREAFFSMYALVPGFKDIFGSFSA